MKILHCPKGEDPLTYARGATRRGGGGLAGILHGNGLVIGLVIAMIIGTFTIGPLRPNKDKAPEQQQEQAAVTTKPELISEPVAYSEIVMCALPAGGRIEVGWETLVNDGMGGIKKVRCENDGTLKEIETTF